MQSANWLAAVLTLALLLKLCCYHVTVQELQTPSKYTTQQGERRALSEQQPADLPEVRVVAVSSCRQDTPAIPCHRVETSQAAALPTVAQR
jgi:hypothetical protein